MKGAICTLSVLAVLLAAGPARSQAGDAAKQVRDLVDRMATAADRVKDYTCLFTIEQFVDGAMEPPDTIRVKQRKTPRCAYLKWLKGPNEGREAIYCDDRYGGKLQVREGSGLSRLLGTLSLDPLGKLAMNGNRHPITEVGVYHPMELIQRDFARAVQHPEDAVRIDGVERQTIASQPSHCWTTTQPGDRVAYYAAKTHVCLHDALLLPTLVEAWDASARLVERYTWTDFATNVGLTDADFDVENSAYGF